jgi:hypothetical protein
MGPDQPESRRQGQLPLACREKGLAPGHPEHRVALEIAGQALGEAGRAQLPAYELHGLALGLAPA